MLHPFCVALCGVSWICLLRSTICPGAALEGVTFASEYAHSCVIDERQLSVELSHVSRQNSDLDDSVEIVNIQ